MKYINQNNKEYIEYNFEDNEREGEYEVQSSTISLKEELNKLDHESYENAKSKGAFEKHKAPHR